MFLFGFACSLPHFLLRLSLIVLSSWEYPSVGYFLWCYCLYASVLFFLLCLFLLFCSSLLLLLQLFLHIQYVISFSPASGGQMVIREKFARWLKQLFPSKSKYLTLELLLDIVPLELRNTVTGLWLGFFCLHTKNEDEVSRYSKKKLCVLWGMLFECELIVYASNSSNVLIPWCLNHNIFHKVVIFSYLLFSQGRYTNTW